MHYYHRWRRFKLILPCALLIMILMRLVWIQLRAYPLISDYRSMVTIHNLNVQYPATCGVNLRYESDYGLKDFVEVRELGKVKDYLWFKSPGFGWLLRLSCGEDGNFDPNRLVRINLWLFVFTAVLIAALLRLLTSSWILALAGVTILLSRGSLIADLGDLTPQVVTMMLLSLWFVLGVHFFKSGSYFSFGSMFIVVAIGAFIDPALSFLAFTLPVMLVWGFLLRRYLSPSILMRVRNEKRKLRERFDQEKPYQSYREPYSLLMIQLVEKLIGRRFDRHDPQPTLGQIYQESGFLSILRIPFALWITQRRRFVPIILISLTIGLISLVGSLTYIWTTFDLSMRNHFIEIFKTMDGGFKGDLSYLLMAWFEGFVTSIDFHLGASLLIVLVCALQSPARGFLSFFESVWCLITMMAMTLVGALFFDYLDLQTLNVLEPPVGGWSVHAWSRNSTLLLFFEPILLSMGVGGCFNLFQVAQRRMNPVGDRR